MALTSSTMLPLGTPAPAFSLPDTVSGRTISLSDFAGKKALVVMFICNHCPYVKHVQPELVRLGKDYEKTDAAIVAISSNDSTQAKYADDAPGKLAEEARRVDYRFPCLFDEDQSVAKAYSAACTPDFYVFGPQRKLVYRGQLDDSRPGNGRPLTGRDLRTAIDAVLANHPVDARQKPSIGCNIKWKPGNEPAYFSRPG